MQIAEVMTSRPLTCAPDTTAAEAAHLMWEGDCGVLPVVWALKAEPKQARKGPATSAGSDLITLHGTVSNAGAARTLREIRVAEDSLDQS